MKSREAVWGAWTWSAPFKKATRNVSILFSKKFYKFFLKDIKHWISRGERRCATACLLGNRSKAV